MPRNGASAPPGIDEIYSIEGSRALMERIKARLAEAGLERTSGYAGGEITGLTSHYGSTGFSVRPQEDGSLSFHVVVSGRGAGLSYRDFKEIQGDEIVELSEPTNSQILYPRIEKVFEEMGFSVREVRESGHQLMWDDDVDFDVVVEGLEQDPEAVAQAVDHLAEQARFRPAMMQARISEEMLEKQRLAAAARNALQGIPKEHLTSAARFSLAKMRRGY